jgi:HD-like signal output (HDOD) protein
MKKQPLSLLDIIDQLLESDSAKLPVFDPIGLEIQRKLKGDHPDLQDIETSITKDQALTGLVLKTANSAFYKGLATITTVKKAIIRLGVDEIANMVIMATHQKHFRAADPAGRATMKRLWEHAIGTAIGAQWLAREQGLSAIVHEAFTAGLLHDVGKLLLYTVMESIKKESDCRVHPSKELSEEVVENFHARYGFLLLNTWNLPKLYCEIARDHHLESNETDDVLLLMVRLVNMACRKIGIGLKHEPDIILAATPEASALGVSEITLARLEINLEDTQLLTEPDPSPGVMSLPPIGSEGPQKPQRWSLSSAVRS